MTVLYTIEDLITKKPGGSRLTPLYFGEYKVYANGKRDRTVVCICVCGELKTVPIPKFTSGGTSSCGCKQHEAHYLKHGLSHKHPLYSVWTNIKGRCTNFNHKAYKYYGGRGVKMCEEWINDFKAFYDWAIENGWKKGLQLDKDIIPKKLGIPAILYSPEMCCFVTPKENYNTRSSSVYLEHDNKNITMSKWAELLGIPKGTITSRYFNGMTVENVLSVNRVKHQKKTKPMKKLKCKR